MTMPTEVKEALHLLIGNTSVDALEAFGLTAEQSKAVHDWWWHAGLTPADVSPMLNGQCINDVIVKWLERYNLAKLPVPGATYKSLADVLYKVVLVSDDQVVVHKEGRYVVLARQTVVNLITDGSWKKVT